MPLIHIEDQWPKLSDPTTNGVIDFGIVMEVFRPDANAVHVGVSEPAQQVWQDHRL